MRFFDRLATLAFASVLATAAHAQVQVQDAWVRSTVPGQSGTGAFMRLTSAQDTTLVAVSSTLTAATELHEMTMQGDVMKMREIPSLALPAGKTVELKPGGYHVMLMNLTQQVKAGDVVPLTLTFQNAAGQRQDLQVQVPVHPLNASGAATHDHSGGHKH
ncbi:MAG: copper chaperone PCu(A)C [Burkholderiaceae bacterium]